MQENMFAQPDSPHKNCTSIQGNHLSLDVTRKIQVEIARERHTTEYMKVSTNNISSRAVQQIIPDTSASMYNIYPNGAVQPRVQVVQGGRSHVIIQPQSPAVVVPGMASQAIFQAAQPAMVIQPAAPAVRVIQPQVLPTVIQPAANTIVYRHY
ncbi:hypothetical protein PDJAM_G00161840 [Pangasius djambal]|uniref:Uncharacterized protein n=1 Tax=Pangasius djambal TaxID=1691987 RepID=A0ACC5ZM14_9TELE|nr:hypothetical protein [Pangasius djambal]